MPKKKVKQNEVAIAEMPIAATPQIVDNQNRKVLGEGRNYQMGFAFCKRDGDTYNTVQPISPCKDYLNDVVYTEATGKGVHAYGLSTKKQDIYDGDKAYIAMKICKRFPDEEYPNYHKDIENLEKNYENLQKFLNIFENQVGIVPTQVIKTGDNMFLMILDTYWCQASWLISLWGLLCRVGQYFDGNTDPKVFWDNFKASDDTYLVASVKGKFDKWLNGEKCNQPFGTSSSNSVHDYGIVAAQF